MDLSSYNEATRLLPIVKSYENVINAITESGNPFFEINSTYKYYTNLLPEDERELIKKMIRVSSDKIVDELRARLESYNIQFLNL